MPLKLTDDDDDAIDIRRIPGATGYLASRNGRIYALHAGALVEKKRSMGAAYLMVGLSLDVGVVSQNVHALIAQTFLTPPKPEQTHVRHFDGNKMNNRAGNLAWGTAQDNSDDELRLGRTLHGSMITNSKLCEADVVAIRCSVAAGDSNTEIAERFGVTGSLVGQIAIGKIWVRAGGPIQPRLGRRSGERAHNCKLTDADVAAIRGLSPRPRGQIAIDLAAKYGVTVYHIRAVARGAQRKPMEDTK